MITLTSLLISGSIHNTEFLERIITEVINQIGVEKIGSIITDNDSTMKAARNKISQKYPSIISHRCFLHFLNLIILDLKSNNTIGKTLEDCNELVSYINKHTRIKSLLKNESERYGKHTTLKSFVKTRWHSIYDCFNSINKNKASLITLGMRNQNEINQNIKLIINNATFWDEIQIGIKVTKPIKESIKCLESRQATLSDCFFHLMKIFSFVYKIDDNHLIKSKIIASLIRRLNELDIELMALCYFLHPYYRGIGIQNSYIYNIKKRLGEFAKVLQYGIENTKAVIEQLMRFKNKFPPYDVIFS